MTFLVAMIALIIVAWYLWESSRRRTGAMSEGIHEDICLPYEQSWELYHNSFSLCSKKIRVCLAELGIPYKSHHVDLIETGAYENISRRFLAVNPASLVPVLVHEGHPIYESHAQLVYASSHSQDPYLLTPLDAGKREVMEAWVHKTSLIGDDPVAGLHETMGNAIPGLTLPIFATMIEKIPVHRIMEGLLFHRFKQRPLVFLLLKLRGPKKLPRTRPMVKVIRDSIEAMHGHLDELEAALSQSGGPWVVGDQFTLADVGLMVILDRLDEGDWLEQFLIDARPRVRQYWDELRNRPSFSAAVDAFRHPAVDRGTARIKELKATEEPFLAMLRPG